MKLLFEKAKLGGLETGNRITVPAMVPYGWADDSGVVSDRHVAHYEAIARGGPGLIIQEGTCVSKNGRLTESQLGIWEDGHIPGLRRIVQAVHAQGVPILVQLHHAGIGGVGEDLVCPSAYECQLRGEMKKARALTLEELREIQKDFINAARRAWEAGYDGVELHGCHSYLMSQFFNRNVNRRTDEYGLHRELFAVEIFREVKKQAPDGALVGFRLGGFEPTLEDAIAHARILAEEGADFLDISYGFVPAAEPFAPEGYPFKDIIYAAHEIKKAVRVPVFAVNGINSPELAEHILEVTGVDRVDIGRGTLVNYSWPADAAAGRNVGRCLDCKICQWRVDSARCPGRIRHQRAQTQA